MDILTIVNRNRRVFAIIPCYNIYYIQISFYIICIDLTTRFGYEILV